MSDLLRRFTRTDAGAHGRLVTYDEVGGRVFGECEVDRERCWTFGAFSSSNSLEERFIEHAAAELGVCWACSGPVDGWPNRERCERCWLMWHAERRVWPRDCPPFPGARS